MLFKSRDSFGDRLWPKPFIDEPEELSETGPQTRRLPTATICLLLLSLVGSALQLPIALTRPWAYAIVAIWILSAAYIVSFRPRVASIFLLLDFVAAAVAGLSHFALQFINHLGDTLALLAGTSIIVAFSAIIILINMPLRSPHLSAEKISRPFTVPTKDLRSPEDNMTLLQWMTVSWMAPLIKIGNERQLNDEDVWFLPYEFQHRHLHDAFRELHGSVVRRLLAANWIDLVILTLLAISELAANYSAPMILQKLLQAMEIISVDKRPAIIFASLILALRLVAAQSGVFSLWFGRRCYERSRGEMITMLYEKTLNRKIVGGQPQDEQGLEDGVNAGAVTEASGVEDETTDTETDSLLGGDAKRPLGISVSIPAWFAKVKSFFSRSKSPQAEEKMPATLGKILNLMRNDVYEVAQRFWEFQTLIKQPIGLILSIALIWTLLGWASFIGVAVVIVGQLLNYILARILMIWERKRRKAVDTKLQKISQYVESIRHLRWYGWQYKWLDGVMNARQKELTLRVICSLWNSGIKFLNSLTAGMVPVASFYAYTVLAGKQLRIDVAFPSLQLFTMLQGSLRELPQLITVLLNASVAVGRISDFIAEPDKGDEDRTPTVQEGDNLEFRDASYSWPGFSQLVLSHLDLSFPTGLTVIFGPVASGKTALLQALLGELDLQSGSLVKPDTAIGYCAQTPWLQNMSIRDNITFISPYDDARYKQCLEACALLPDLANFKHGDLSHIGDNGIGLSGGQKARVALARAVYSRANILLLDDPLSALDQQTAEWVVTKCLTSPLMDGRKVILATHRTDLCRHVATQLIQVSLGRATVHAFDDDISAPASSAATTMIDPVEETQGQGEEGPEIDEAAAVPDKFVEDEHRAHGGVEFAVYWQYLRAGNLVWWAMVVLSTMICRGLFVAESWFLKEWGEAYNEVKKYVFVLQRSGQDAHPLTTSPISRFFDRFPDPAEDLRPWLLGLFIVVLGETFALILSDIFMVVVTYIAAKNMFKDIMNRISHATFHFYDVTPVGRLMNRMTSDVSVIDGPIATQFLVVIWYGVAWLASMVVIASITPIFLIFAVALTLVFVAIFLQYLPTTQSLRRLEMVSLSPLMSNFGALLHGLTTVRAFCAQAQFQERIIQVTDAFQKMDHFYWSIQAWLMYRFDLLSAGSTFLLTLLAVFSRLTPGLTAFVLIAANKFVQTTHIMCKQYAMLQLEFVSVERVVALTHVEQEDAGTIEPPAAWPRYGSEITLENVTVRYRANMEPALTDVSVSFKPGSTNAITGRTGSGKSTLALALLATVKPESGRIMIDGIDISRVSKQALRTRITFLAQDPILFAGTLRHNLDPMDEHSDEECLAVIARVCGKYGWTLATTIDDGGKNLSQGQRQLVGLARAILRRSAIVVMDEATASIDLDTAAEIQRVLRNELSQSTIITIAHRAAAVESAEFAVVLAAGRVLSQGVPDALDDAAVS
ncbi:hypothetical protein B0A52_03008 [Exophiala mesophila]|uniref:ABC transporter n=1 Tax=Exophiala mesophila TaxID=212818 RepID=A0A438NC82_EXOME|nr:hypothetical protein B0A52_03008 [Exophiala mesophila]